MLGRRLLIAALALALSGCSVTGYLWPQYLLPSKRKEVVTERTEAFAANLRWGRYQVAAAHVAHDKRIDFLKLVHDPQAPVRFTDYEVLSVEMGPKWGEARALVRFELHRLPSMTEIAFNDEQVWRYDAQRSGWFLEPELAAYRDAGKPLARRQ